MRRLLLFLLCIIMMISVIPAVAEEKSQSLVIAVVSECDALNLSIEEAFFK